MIGSVLTLKQLEALIWVADLGSFRAAAHHLNTTQPNISARIAGLEKTLGLSLMARNSGSIALTDKGIEILRLARKMIGDAEQIVHIAERPDLLTDRLRLGVTELVACTWLHAYLRAIKAAYPALNVELTVDLSRHLDVELSANRLDLTIQTAPFESSVDGNIDLGEFPYLWVAEQTIAKQLQGEQSVADLMPHSVLTHARHTQAVTELFAHTQKHTIPTAQMIASNSLASCVQMAADGMGVTLLPEALVRGELANGSLVPINVDWLPSPLSFFARFRADTGAQYLADCAGFAEDCAKLYAPQ